MRGRRPFIFCLRCRKPQAANPFRPPRREKRRAAFKTEPIWPCTGRGLHSRSGRPLRWRALTPPFHPYLLSYLRRRFAFCCPNPWGRPRSSLTTSLPFGVRTFLHRPKTAAAALHPPLFIIPRQWPRLQDDRPRNSFPCLCAILKTRRKGQ